MVDPLITDVEYHRLYHNRPLAHQVFFRHRYSHKTPAFHEEIIRLWHSRTKQICFVSFRGSAKTTLAEEAIILAAAFREFEHCLLVGAALPRAIERLQAIKLEIESNEYLAEMFGDLRGGPPWGDSLLRLSNGAIIRPVGRGQPIRGVKGWISRPDLIVPDDIESDESVEDIDRREDNLVWFFGQLMQVVDNANYRVRMLSNDLHPECIARKLKNPKSGWLHKTYPCEYKDDNGFRVPMWPDKFPLHEIDKKRNEFYAVGKGMLFEREFMCQAEAPESRPFKKEMFKIEPITRSWQPVYIVFDPARSASATSADTGYVAASWISNKMVVWGAWGRHLSPDQIVEAVFKADSLYNPLAVWIEDIGLKDWILEPIRHRQIKEGRVIPVNVFKREGPKQKRIGSLLPFFIAGDIIFATHLPELEQQLLSYPSGKVDIVDALAYMLYVRKGFPVYEDFGMQNVSEEKIDRSGGITLSINSGGSYLAGIVIRFVDGRLFVLGDYLREGVPSDMVGDLIDEVCFEYGEKVRVVVPPDHFEKYNTSGIVQAIRRRGTSCGKGNEIDRGSAEVRSLLRSYVRGKPSFIVHHGARWTINAMCAGYVRKFDARGKASDDIEDNQYRTLMRALETACGSMHVGSSELENANYSVLPDGRKYISSMPSPRISR